MNQRIKTLYLAGRYEEAIQESNAYPSLSPNGLTHEFLALCYLESGAYQQSIKHIEPLLQQYPHSPDFLRIKACVYIGQALAELGARVRYNQCLIVSPLYYMPDRAQQDNLQKAFDCLTAGIPYADKNHDLEWYLSTLTAISAVSPDKDEMLWLMRLEREFPLSPIAVFIRVILHKYISDAQVEAFLSAAETAGKSSGYFQAAFMMLMEKGRYQEARVFLALHENDIIRAFSATPGELEFMIAQHLNDWESVEKIADRAEDSIIKKRMRLTADINSKQLSKKEKTKMIIAFTKETGLPCDYQTAYQYFQANNDWQKALQIARAWHTVSPTLAVKMRCVESLINYGREQKALQLIDKIESAGYSSKQLFLFKVRCLYTQSRLNEVLNLLDSVQFEQQDSELVLHKADSHIICGDTDSAIQCLKEYIDRGYRSKRVINNLVALLRAVNMDEACVYALKGHEMYPDDKMLLRDGFLLCTITGRAPPADWEALQTMSEPDSPYFKLCDLVEAKKVMDSVNKQIEDFTNDYYQLKLPLCLYQDALPNGSLAISLYLQWKKGILGSALTMCANGIRNFTPDAGECMVLDYTALVSSIELGILEQVCSIWTCYISPKLMPLIISEIVNLNNMQQLREEENEGLLVDMDKSSIYYVERISDIEIKDFYSYLVAAAKEFNYLIVSETPAPATGIPLPDEWEKYCIGPQVFFAYLQHKKLLSVSPSDEVDIQFLLEQLPSAFLLDRATLHQLSDRRILTLVADSIPIAVTKKEYERLQNDVQQFHVKRDATAWLRTTKDTVSDLISRKKILILENKYYHDNDDRYPCTNLFIHEFELARRNNYFLWSDDRFIFSYNGCAFLSIFNILNALYKEDSPGLYLKMDFIFERHIGNILPGPRYLLSRLQLCGVDEATGTLRESSALKNIRNTVCGTIGTVFCLSNRISSKNPSERHGYLSNLRDFVFWELSLIWKHAEALSWKCAASTWVLDTFFVSQFEAEEDMDEHFATQYMQTRLISMGLGPLRKESKPYYDWLIGYLEPAWNASPEDESGTAEFIIDLVTHLKTREEVILAFNWLAKEFVGSSFLYNLFWILSSEGLIAKGYDFAAYFKKREIVTLPVCELDSALLDAAVAGSSEAQEHLLLQVYENPECCAQVVSFLEAASSDIPIGLHFLSTLFWYVKTEYRARIRKLYFQMIDECSVK